MKIKILGVSRDNKRSNYIFSKEQNFIKGFKQFLLDLGFKQFDLISSEFGYALDKKGNPLISEEINIKKYEDNQFFFQNKNYKIDLILGKSKIFLTIYPKQDKQKEIAEKINKFCDF